MNNELREEITMYLIAGIGLVLFMWACFEGIRSGVILQ